MELNIEKFSPAKAELKSLVEKAKLVTKQSTEEEIHEMRKTLRSTRTSITGTGKVMREDAVRFQKEVVAKEKELVAIISPEEDRIAAIEDELQIKKERAERRAILPQRRTRLEAIDKDLINLISDEEILDMDSTQFEGYLNAAHAEKNRAEEDRIAAEKRKLEVEKEELQRKQDLVAAEERGRRQEREQADAEKERVAREAKEKEEREAREKKDAEEREERERQRLEGEKAYKAFLKKNGYTPETADNFVIARSDSEVKLYKLISVFKLTNQNNSHELQ